MSIINNTNFEQVGFFCSYDDIVQFHVGTTKYNLHQIQVDKAWFDGMVISNLGNATKFNIQGANDYHQPLTFDNFNALVQLHLKNTEVYLSKVHEQKRNTEEIEHQKQIDLERTVLKNICNCIYLHIFFSTEFTR